MWADLVSGTSGLRALNGNNCQAVLVQGYWSSGDGGGGLFAWVIASTLPGDNGGTIILPNVQPSTTGYWKRVYDGPINVRYFGAKGDGATDDTSAINAALTLAASFGGPNLWGADVFFPPGTYCADNLQINQHNISVRGAGKSTIL